MSLESRLEKEIDAIENDDTLTNQEKSKEIRELYRDARAYQRERAQEAYDNIMEGCDY
jgi:hypothetical protein